MGRFSKPDLISPHDLEEDAREKLSSAGMVTEAWACNSSEGIMTLGPISARMHGLKQSCGLLDLLRCYPREDRAKILQQFEEFGESRPSLFFSTTISTPFRTQALLCVGTSTGASSGGLKGAFVFPGISHAEVANTNIVQ